MIGNFTYFDIMSHIKKCLDRMEAYMNHLGLVISSMDLNITEEIMDDIPSNSFIVEGRYKALTHDEILYILKESMV